MSGAKKAHKHKSVWPVTLLVRGEFLGRVPRGQSFMYCPRNASNISNFAWVPVGRIGDRGDRQEFCVKSFMSQCLFCSLLCGSSLCVVSVPTVGQRPKDSQLQGAALTT